MAQRGRKPSSTTKPRNLNSNVIIYDASEDVIKQMKKLARSAIVASARVAAKAIKKATPVRSGKLKEAAGYKTKFKKGRPVAMVGFFNRKNAIKKKRMFATNFLANPAWLQFGSRAHVSRAGIRRKVATGKMALSNGTTMYGKKVNHPGTKGTGFMSNALKDNVTAIHKAQQKKLALLNQTLDQLKSIKDEPEQEETV